MNRTEEILKRVNRYLSFMRYKYSTQEQLSRLNVIEGYYKSLEINPTEEKLVSEINFSERLGKNLLMPLKVRGVFLTEGRHLKKFYKAVDIELSAENPINQKFPLMLDHKDRLAGQIIGIVDKIHYDERIRGLRWEGHVNDETFARNILDGVITQVSATIDSEKAFDRELGLLGINITFKELSLVIAGQDPGNYIEPA